MNNIKSNLDTLDLNILQTKNNKCYIGLRNGSLRLASQLFKIKRSIAQHNSYYNNEAHIAARYYFKSMIVSKCRVALARRNILIQWNLGAYVALNTRRHAFNPI